MTKIHRGEKVSWKDKEKCSKGESEVHESTRGRAIKRATRCCCCFHCFSLSPPFTRLTFKDVYWHREWNRTNSTSLFDVYIAYIVKKYACTHIIKAVCVSVLTYLDDHPLHLTRYSSFPCGNQTRVEDHDSRAVNVCLCVCSLPSSGVCWGYTRHQRPALPPRSAPPWLFSSHSHLILRDRVCERGRAEQGRGGRLRESAHWPSEDTVRVTSHTFFF